jgi:hypothetical protein
VFYTLAEQKQIRMKKMVLTFVLMIGAGICSYAQSTPAKTTKTTASTATASKPAATTATTKTATAAGPTKKDGTADMRYKTNKDAAKAAPVTTTHTKKDGTPDKRYKENKK